jgi:hypothetical protein
MERLRTPFLSLVVAGRNDDYGKDFRERLFRTSLHNSALLEAAGIDFEYLLAEWNPLPDRALLSEEFVERVPNARTVVIPPAVHQQYGLNPRMPFHEMAAKNAALRRAHGEFVIVTNADILFSEDLVSRIASWQFASDTLYRAHRIDVNPELTWADMRKPLNQLPSGEGLLPPTPYLGAGGDFCLASRSLWHSLRGFNETVRFSTRAKDWQFFLSALAQGVHVEFIGDVYHLDHEGGFRNTNASELNSDVVHFGKWWDIEFGLPVFNSPSWGLHDLSDGFSLNGNIGILHAQDYAVSEEQNRLDREVMSWITRTPGTDETQAAVLLHTICAAHRERRRLIFRLNSSTLAATLCGFEAVASRYGVAIHCDWNWPAVPGYSIPPFASEPKVLREEDWVIEEIDGVLTGQPNGLPSKLPIKTPEFNPVLARRILRAYLELQEKGQARIVIYGGGSHTAALLQWGMPDIFELVATVDSRTLSTVADRTDVDAVLLSSASFESDLAETCREYRIGNVVALYGDWISFFKEQGCKA